MKLKDLKPGYIIRYANDTHQGPLLVVGLKTDEKGNVGLLHYDLEDPYWGACLVYPTEGTEFKPALRSIQDWGRERDRVYNILKERAAEAAVELATFATVTFTAQEHLAYLTKLREITGDEQQGTQEDKST